MEKERILLGKKDKTPFESELTASQNRLNDVFSALSDFIPNPDMNDLRDVMTGGKGVKMRLDADVADTLAAIKIPSLKVEQEAKLKQLSNDLNSLIAKAQSYKGSLINFIPDTLIELHGGHVRFSSDAGKLIDDHVKIYIETDDQRQVYDLSRILADTVNKLQPYITLYRYNDVMQVLKTVDGKKVANDDFAADMPRRLAFIKERQEMDRRDFEEREAAREAERKAKEERFAGLPANISIEQAMAMRENPRMFGLD